MIFEAQMYVSGQGKWWQYSNSFLYVAKLQYYLRILFANVADKPIKHKDIAEKLACPFITPD